MFSNDFYHADSRGNFSMHSENYIGLCEMPIKIYILQ